MLVLYYTSSRPGWLFRWLSLHSRPARPGDLSPQRSWLQRPKMPAPIMPRAHSVSLLFFDFTAQYFPPSHLYTPRDPTRCSDRLGDGAPRSFLCLSPGRDIWFILIQPSKYLGGDEHIVRFSNVR
jgi:hypothetical protein